MFFILNRLKLVFYDFMKVNESYRNDWSANISAFKKQFSLRKLEKTHKLKLKFNSKKKLKTLVITLWKSNNQFKKAGVMILLQSFTSSEIKFSLDNYPKSYNFRYWAASQN